MAHELANTADRTDGSSEKVRLNRREYLKMGAAATAITLAMGPGSSALAAETETVASFGTGFGEYA
jgi:hypothetical protein